MMLETSVEGLTIQAYIIKSDDEHQVAILLNNVAFA